MNKDMKINLDENVEPILTHIPVPCTKSLLGRYRDVARRLEEASPSKKKLLTRKAREALESVVKGFEAALNGKAS